MSNRKIVLDSGVIRVDRIDGDESYVTRTDPDGGRQIHGTWPTAWLREHGFKEHDRFSYQTTSNGDGNGPYTEFTLIPDAKLTDDEVQAIKAKIEAMLPLDGTEF